MAAPRRMRAPHGRLYHLNEPTTFLSGYRQVACSSRGTFVEEWAGDGRFDETLPLCQRCVNRWCWWLATIPADYERMLVDLVEAHHAVVELPLLPSEVP